MRNCHAHITLFSFAFAGVLLTGRDVGGRGEKPTNSILIRQNIAYRPGPNKHWRLDLAMKNDVHGKPRPGIVVIHGGGWIEGDKSSFTFKKHGVPGNIEEFAALGFVAVTINYRLSGEAPFPAALEDCQCAVRWLRAHAQEYNLDPEHIGAYGNSAGGHLALLMAMLPGGFEGDGPYREQSNAIQAAVSDSGPLDLLEQYKQNRLRRITVQFLGGPPEGKRIELYKTASPSQQINAKLPPVLLTYGGADEQVPVETADEFVRALGRAGIKDVSYYRLAYVDHCPHSLVRVPILKQAVNDFFLRTLMHPESARAVRRRVVR